jgi:hypothetical protein
VCAATGARAAADDVFAGAADGEVTTAAEAVVRAADVPAAAVVPAAVAPVVLDEKGVHPVRTSTRRAIPLRVRRIHPE